MPLDLSGFNNGTQQWAGLYHAADSMEKRKLRTDQLAAQQQAKRGAAGTFLQNYLDPKDYLTGTQFDPMILQGLDAAMQQGSQLAAAGADSPTLLMAMGPMMSKLTKYSTNAKNINKQVDDQISKMKDSGHIGYDYGKIKEEALKQAFYKTDANGQLQLDPDQADPSVDWVTKAIQNSPEKVTTSLGWDKYANDAKMKTDTDAVTNFNKYGDMNKHKVGLKFQEYMVPERKKDKFGQETGEVVGFVPKYQTAVDGGKPIMHSFNGKDGKPVKAAVRVVDEDLFDGLPQGLQDNIRGQVKQHINEYETSTGEKITMGSPKAKLIARALAYDELNRPQRNHGGIDENDIYNKPSQQHISLTMGQTPEYIEMLRKKAEAQTEGHLDAKGKFRSDAGDTFMKITGGDPQYLQGETVTKGGQQVIDVTQTFPGGGLKAGRGANYEYGGIFFNPVNNSFMIEKELPADRFGKKEKKLEAIPEKDFGKFLYTIAKSNDMSYSEVEQMLKEMGYKNGAFKNTAQKVAANDVNKRLKWNEAMKQPLGQALNQNQTTNQRLGPTLNQNQ